MSVCECVCTDPGQLLLQGLLGGLRAAVQLGALLANNLSQPLYSVPFCLQQLTRLAYTHMQAYGRTHTHACPQKKKNCMHTCVHVYIQRNKCTHAQTQNTHTGQREDGRVSGTGEPQLVTTATRPGRSAYEDGV